MADIVELTEGTFEEAVSNNPITVIDCWAVWCGPCQVLTPIMEQLAEEYSGKVAFAKLDVDQNQNVARKYRIMAIPTLLYFKDGELADTTVGVFPKNEIMQRIEKLM